MKTRIKKLAPLLALFTLALIFFGFTINSLYAADPIAIPSTEDNDTVGGTPNILTKIGVLALFSLLPYGVMLLTSFLKMVVVLSLLRNALGVQQSPPNPAINGIALLMAIYVMFPTGLAMYNAAESYIQKAPPQALFSDEAAGYIIGVADKAKEPLKEFLQKNSITKHQRYFFQLAYRSFPGEFKKRSAKF